MSLFFNSILECYFTSRIANIVTFPKDFINFGVFTFNASDFDWTDIVQRGIAEEEEHNIKLVYVARELWKRYGKWSGFSEAANSFTVTPSIGPASTSFAAATD